MSGKKSKTSTSIGRDPVLDLYFSKKKRRGAIVLMKCERSYAQARTLLPKLGTLTMHHDLRLAIAGTVAPSTWDEVITPTLLPRSKDWLQEFGWLAHGFLAGADRLNSFLEYRKKFGRAYLLGDYASAKENLNDIAEKHGVSLWLAEREFMLLQASAGFEGHKQKLSEIQASLKNSVAGYFVTILSNRLEPHVTPEAFQRATGEELDEARADGHEVFASWAELHIAPWRFGWLDNKHEMLHHCGGKTLVDRYDRAIKILSCVQFDTLDQNARRLLSSVLDDLASVINDRQLTHLVGKLEQGSNPTDARTDCYFEMQRIFGPVLVQLREWILASNWAGVR